MRKVTLVDNISFQNLTIGQDRTKEEPLETTDTLVPPPVATASALATDMEKPDNNMEDNNREQN